MKVDVLAVGAHPDDIEIGIGGFVHKLCQRGIRVGMLDLTRGEMGTRGTPGEREGEGAAAAAILGAAWRGCAELPDGAVANTKEQQHALIPLLRRLQPRVILAPMKPDRHPDHAAAHELVCDANFLAGLARIETDAGPHRASTLYFYTPYYDLREAPPLVVDITGHFEAKVEALRAHASQFHNPAYEGKETWISSKAFWDTIEIRAAYWGQRAGVRHGEPLHAITPLAVDVPPGMEGLPCA